jgi:hypothetical protein
MNAIKATVLSWFLPPKEDAVRRPPKKSSGQWVRSSFAAGKFDQQIQKAELDYKNGKALDRLY